MIEEHVGIATRDGLMDTFICRPERNAPFPIILFYMDAPGIREELRDMVRRFATVGYYVMLPNLYYRSGVTELGPISLEENHPSRARMTELKDSLSIPMVGDDTDALIAYAGEQAAARDARIGCVGYCMSGQYATGAAMRHPERVAAVASIYGISLVTDRPESPHLAPQRTNAEYYFACAEIDRWIPIEMVDELRRALAGAKNAEVEFYPGVEHGFAFPKRAAYHKPSAERHWERLFALFARRLLSSKMTLPL
jgi:carboxymethylenebutenolidase